MRTLLLLLAACAPVGADTGDTGDAGDTGGRDTGADTALPDLADLEALTHEDPGCETFDAGSGPQPVPGATGWYVGRFAVDGDEAQGVEEWLLYANDTWTAGHDCRVVWRAGGARSDCAGCDHRLELAMLLDESASNCPQGLVAQQPRAFEVTYLVTVDGDVSSFRWEGASALGEGPVTDGDLAYVAGPSCKWF